MFEIMFEIIFLSHKLLFQGLAILTLGKAITKRKVIDTKLGTLDGEYCLVAYIGVYIGVFSGRTKRYM